MQENKIYLACAAFICLSAVKLCFPSVPAQLREEAGNLLFSNTDFSAAIQAMGRSLSHGDLEDQLVQVLGRLGLRDKADTEEIVPALEEYLSSDSEP